jgi:hypothetical protein
MKKILYLFIISVCFACEEGILIDVEQADSKIVIEGLLTNQSGKQFVKVARTVGFYDEGINPAVSGATVRVTDNLGNVTPYTESENSGVYLPDAAFVGQVGRTYSLEVVVDGDTYSATEELLSVTKIDSLTYGISEEEYGDPEEKG